MNCMNTAYLRQLVYEIKNNVLDITTKAGRGHVTSCFSCAELVTVLYFCDFLKIYPDEPDNENRDYFILSKGHADALLYVLLAKKGFFDNAILSEYCMKNGRIGPLLRADISGVEITAGSLGCGLGIAAGIATALKIDKCQNKVWCLLGDAECHEGSVWEAAYLVGSKALDNLIVIVDCNKMGATHFIEDEVKNEPFKDKWKSFGFNVLEIDGHSINQIKNAYAEASVSNRPVAILANTVKGKGITFMENEPFMHGVAVQDSRLEEAKRMLSDEVKEHYESAD